MRMCGVLEVSKSGYYAWPGRGRSGGTRHDELLPRMKVIRHESRGTYGVPRVQSRVAVFAEADTAPVYWLHGSKAYIFVPDGAG
ncbi:MAG: hypothetical protein AB1700_17555 [Bacillota bacterium]